MIVDSQVHIWGADRPDRPWPAGQAHRAHREIPLSHEALLEEMAEAGVDRAILVPPSYEGDRNDLVIAAARAHPDRFAAMGRVPIEDPAGPKLFRNWRIQGMLGVRLTFHIPPVQKWLYDGTADWFWPAAEEQGIPVMILPTGVVPEMGKIAARHPRLRLIIDHFALHRLKGEAAHIDHAAIDQLIELARYPNVAVKASALPTFSSEPYPFRDLHDMIRRVYDAFGSGRMFWGSDLSRLPCTYRQAVTLFTEQLPWLRGEDLDRVMGRSLCQWLDWKVA